MRMLVAVAALVVLAAGSTSAQSWQERPEVTTRHGVLSVGPDQTLLFKGRPIRPLVQGNNSLDLAAPYRIGSADVVLAANNGGTGCPTLYYFVTITAAGAKATPAFGTCADVTKVDRSGDTLLVRMSGFLGPFEPEQARIRASRERHVFVYRAGAVTKNGKPVR